MTLVPPTAMVRLFVVEAGASAAAPAQLPVFALLRAFLIKRLRLADGAVAPAGELAPERFMQSIFDGGLPLEAWLTQTLGVGEPNAVHHVLAAALAAGDSVWTVNVDELIERAAARSWSAASLAFRKWVSGCGIRITSLTSSSRRWGRTSIPRTSMSRATSSTTLSRILAATRCHAGFRRLRTTR